MSWLAAVSLTLAGAAAVAPAAPAARAGRPATGFMPVGALNYIWQAETARGCAAQGLCGVVGSLQVVTGNTSNSGGPGLPPIDIQDNSAVARVRRIAPDGAPHACGDLVPYDVQFVLRHLSGGRLRAVPEPAGTQPPSAGQCAGPTAADLASVMLPARKLGHRGYDLSGTVAFGTGPFAVTVVSTIRALFVSSGTSGAPAPPLSSPGPRPPRLKSALAERADVAYRVTGLQGRLAAAFLGRPEPPFCAPLDACGTTGAVSLMPRGSGRTLEFSGFRLVKRRVGARQALADLRGGHLHVGYSPYSSLRLGGELTGTLAGANATPCRDTVSDSSLDLVLGSARAGYRLTLSPSGPVPSFFGPDELRTRCPGPGSSEILGAGPLAGGAVPVGAVGAAHLTIVLNAAGRFRGSAYSGTRSGAIVLTLLRTRVSGGTRRVRVIGGQVVG